VRKFPELSKFELTKIYLGLFFEDLIGRQFKSAYFTLHILIFGKQAEKYWYKLNLFIGLRQWLGRGEND